MRRLLLFVALLLGLPSLAGARGVAADRYDVTIRAVDDGTIQVTETMRLQFSGGPFTYINREIPTRRSDGIEVLGASMDGHVMRRGGGEGQFEVRIRDSRVAIRWRFAQTSDSRHEFRVSYLVRGLIRREGGGGLLEWQALPSEHSYPIAASRVLVEGEGLDSQPAIRTRRVGRAQVVRVNGGWEIDARAIDANGWVSISTAAPLAAGVTPRWQERANRQRALAPRILQFAILAFVLALAVVVVFWRQYPAGPLIAGDSSTFDAPPSARSPAVAAAILAGGHSLNAHAPGTLFDLANRGVLSVAEAQARWKLARKFTLTRHHSVAVAPHESALLDVIFRQEDSIDLATGVSRLMRAGKPFRHAVNEELQRLGLVDEDRRAVRRRLIVVGIALGMLGVAALAVTTVLVPDGGPWTIAIMLAVELAGALALVLGVTRPELSDEGFRERQRWRSFRRALHTRLSAEPSGPEMLRYLPYVAAFGLAALLSRSLRRHGEGAALPPWFQALGGRDGSVAFAAFIGGTAASTAAGSARGSGVAGGGSSSAG